MGRCLEKSSYMKILKKHFELKTNELKYLQIKYDDLERTQSEKVSDKPPNEREIAL